MSKLNEPKCRHSDWSLHWRRLSLSDLIDLLNRLSRLNLVNLSLRETEEFIKMVSEVPDVRISPGPVQHSMQIGNFRDFRQVSECMEQLEQLQTPDRRRPPQRRAQPLDQVDAGLPGRLEGAFEFGFARHRGFAKKSVDF